MASPVLGKENQLKANYHLLVDYENVKNLADKLTNCIVGGLNLAVYVFLGNTQKLCPSLDLYLKKNQIEIRVVRLTKPGKNALDFYISLYAGRIIAEDSLSHVYILSGDRGFDPLVEHCNEVGWLVCRHATLDFLQELRRDAAPATQHPKASNEIHKQNCGIRKQSSKNPAKIAPQKNRRSSPSFIECMQRIIE